jgi:YVTN family beta-propeller protein
MPHGRRQSRRFLATVLFTDIVGSTEHATRLGDRAWRGLIERHHAVVRRELKVFGGREMDTAGDGFFAVFEAPERAVRCAESISAALQPTGVQIRAGVHMGECEVVDGKVGGLTVTIGARIGAEAEAGQVLVSGSVRDMTLGSGLVFEGRGERKLKGVDGAWQVFSLVPDGHVGDRTRTRVHNIVPLLSRRRRKALIAGVLTGVLLVSGGAYAVVRATRAAPVLSADNRVDIIDPDSGNVVEQVMLDQQPAGVAAGAEAVWVTNTEAGTVSRLDPDNRQLRATIDVPGRPAGIVVAGGFAWVVQEDSGSVAQVSPDVDRVVNTVAVGNQPTGIAAGPSGVWVANSTDGTVTRIDPRTGTASKPVDVGAAPTGIAVTDDTVWVTNSAEGNVSAIDASTGTVRANHPVGHGPSGIVAAAGALWVANNLDGSLARLDPDSGTVTAIIPVGKSPTSVAEAGGSIWVTNEDGATLARVDPDSKRVDRTVPVGGAPHGLAAVQDELWVTAGVSGASHRGGTLTVLPGEGYLQSLDPVEGYGQAVVRIPYDGLTGIRRAAGAAGTTLVPDLATAIPEPVPGGRTYSFRLRTGIRYSNGERVRASDLRRGIERAFGMGDNHFAALRGATACLKDGTPDKPTTCDLSSGIQTDDATGAITFHLVRPDPEFVYKLSLGVASPVPAGTPMHRLGSHPMPTTGPYMVTRFVKEQSLEMVRNPYFHEWSRAAKPDGYPDRIVYRRIADPDTALAQVLNGKADIAFGPFPGHAQELKTRYAAQLHVDLSPLFHAMAMTNRQAPFNDVRVRRALNYAVDRDEVARRWGGVDSFRGTCQVLPPGFPGYAPYCPYTHDPDRAKRLVAQSGSRGDRVRIVMEVHHRPLGRYLARVLTDLGYQTHLVLPATYPDWINDLFSQHPEASLLMIGWGADYPAASQFVPDLLGCHGGFNPGQFCEPPVEDKIRRALRLQQSQSPAAGRLWQQADRTAADRAALLPLGIQLDNVVTSKRIGNFLHQPGYGLLVDQLWVDSNAP